MENNFERKLILYHYRRAQIGEVESDTIEFSAILEKDKKRVRVGQHYTDGTDHKPRDIFKFLEEGWKLILVESSYKWCWTARRYVGEYAHSDDEDRYGRPFVNDLWCGWYDKVDVFGEVDVVGERRRRRYEEKLFHNAGNDKETVKFGIPDEIRRLIDETEWLNADHPTVNTKTNNPKS